MSTCQLPQDSQGADEPQILTAPLGATGSAAVRQAENAGRFKGRIPPGRCSSKQRTSMAASAAQVAESIEEAEAIAAAAYARDKAPRFSPGMQRVGRATAADSPSPPGSFTQKHSGDALTDERAPLDDAGLESLALDFTRRAIDRVLMEEVPMVVRHSGAQRPSRLTHVEDRPQGRRVMFDPSSMPSEASPAPGASLFPALSKCLDTLAGRCFSACLHFEAAVDRRTSTPTRR